MDKRLEEKELQVTDWEILNVALLLGVEPRGINFSRMVFMMNTKI